MLPSYLQTTRKSPFLDNYDLKVVHRPKYQQYRQLLPISGLNVPSVLVLDLLLDLELSPLTEKPPSPYLCTYSVPDSVPYVVSDAVSEGVSDAVLFATLNMEPGSPDVRKPRFPRLLQVFQ